MAQMLNSNYEWQTILASRSTSPRNSNYIKQQQQNISNARNVPQNPSQNRSNLLTLGIELDESLIVRLQKNLGVSSIFSVAHKSAELLKKSPRAVARTKNDTHHLNDHVSEVKYRNVSNESQSHMHKDSLKPWQQLSGVLPLDRSVALSLLKGLNDRETIIEPKLRPLIDKLIENLSLIYHRSPERFVGIMLNKKIRSISPKKSPSNNNNNNNNDSFGTNNTSENVAKLILQSRYVSNEDFLIMIQRLQPSTNEDVVSTLFTMLAIEKYFGSNKRIILDLWSFLGLLKSFADESRRSFDSRTSRIAINNEFWTKNLKENEINIDQQQNNEILSNNKINQKDFIQENMNNVSKSNKSKTRFSVANALGKSDYIHNGTMNQGRNVVGTVSSELLNKCDIPTALNSSLTSKRQDGQSAKLSRNQRIDIHGKSQLVEEPPLGSVHESSQIASLLNHNNEDLSEINNNPGIMKKKKATQSMNALYKDSYSNASVSDVLNSTVKNDNPNNISLNSFSKETYNTTSVSDALNSSIINDPYHRRMLVHQQNQQNLISNPTNQPKPLSSLLNSPRSESAISPRNNHNETHSSLMNNANKSKINFHQGNLLHNEVYRQSSVAEILQGNK
eukprot:gene7923-10753_t